MTKLKGNPCDCGRLCNGEKGRTLKEGLYKHKQAVDNGYSNNAIAVHPKNNDTHSIKWTEAQAFECEQYLSIRRSKRP